MFTRSPSSKMKMLRTSLFFTLLLASCSARPSGELDKALSQVVKSFNQAVELTMKQGIGQNFVTLLEWIFNLNGGQTKDFNECDLIPLEENPERLMSPSIRPQLPLPVVSNFTMFVAPLGSVDLILGLSPKNRTLNSDFLLVSDIQIPEDVQLVIHQPDRSTANLFPLGFEVLVILRNEQPVPTNARILNYSLPTLQFSEGFLSPNCVNIVAMPSDSIRLNYSSYSSLSLLPHYHSPSDGLSTTRQIKQVELTVSSKFKKPILAVAPIIVPMPISRIQSSDPIDTLLPSPLALANPWFNEFALIESLEGFAKKYPGTPFFQLPDNFEFRGVPPHEVVLGEMHQVLLHPKSISANTDDYLPLKGPPLHDEMNQIWADFQPVSKMDENPQIPRFFRTLILVSPRQRDLSDNEVLLPIPFTTRVDNFGIVTSQVVMLRNPTLAPSYRHLHLCIVPKVKRVSSTNKDMDRDRSSAKDPANNRKFVVVKLLG